MNTLLLNKTSSNNSNESTKIVHICSQCSRTFKDINNFREHLFQEHGEIGVNVRQCHLCSYATLLKSKYDCHLKCHMNNRVLHCQKCNYSTINIRHMSKHERQHNTSDLKDNTVLMEENSNRELKRVRIEPDLAATSNSKTFVEAETNFETESKRIKTSDESFRFSSCFSTEKLLMNGEKRSDSIQKRNSNDFQTIRPVEISPSAICQSNGENNCGSCTHEHHLINLRSNISTLLRMLLPQLPVYYPSISSNDFDSDQSIDRLVANLIQLPSYYGAYKNFL